MIKFITSFKNALLGRLEESNQSNQKFDNVVKIAVEGHDTAMYINIDELDEKSAVILVNLVSFAGAACLFHHIGLVDNNKAEIFRKAYKKWSDNEAAMRRQAGPVVSPLNVLGNPQDV